MESFYCCERPLIFAHRGASLEAPENTLAAFSLAVEQGADGIELDVQLTRDGQVVVIHDFVLETTTDGQGLVRDKTLAAIEKLNAAACFERGFSRQPIPTLQEVIATLGRKLLLNVELKTRSLRTEGLEAAVVRAIEDGDIRDRVLISSFNPLAVKRIRERSPGIMVGLLHASLPVLLRRPWLHRWIQPDALHPHYSLVDRDYVRWAKARGYRVNVWTVDEAADMKRLARSGVDMIITNRPGLLRDVLLASQQGW